MGKYPMAKVEASTKIVVASCDKVEFARTASEDIAQTAPFIRITAELGGTWDDSGTRDKIMDSCVKKLMDAYRNLLKR